MYINFIKSYLKIFIEILLLLLVTIKFTNAQNTINTSAKFAILIDHETGRILLNKNSDAFYVSCFNEQINDYLFNI